MSGTTDMRGYLRVEEGLLLDSKWHRLSLNAFRVLLVHLKGYTCARRYSAMGMRGIRARTALSPKEVKTATRELVSFGLIRPVETADHRDTRTCIAGLARPFRASHTGDPDPKVLDGHHTRLLERDEVGVSAVPWSLVDPSPDMSEPTIADIGSVEALRLLLWLYLWSRDDGYVHKKAIALKAEPGTAENAGILRATGCHSQVSQLGLGGAVDQALAELLEVGLAYLGPLGKDGLFPVVLLHRRGVDPNLYKQEATQQEARQQEADKQA